MMSLDVFFRPTAKLVLLTLTAITGQASEFYWTDWTTEFSTTHFQGTITTPSSTVTVDYTNLQGIAFFQNNGGPDYWTDSSGARDIATSPYTSTIVDNIPTGTDVIALKQAGYQTLRFSEAIANPVFSYISLNGNGYAFLDQDFDVLSYGDSSDGNQAGYWGAGTSYKEVVDLGNGHIEYRLLGTDEPHGTIQFTGAFDTLTWRSMSGEYWNGFTVGIQGTAVEVLPEPSPFAFLGISAFGFAMRLRRKSNV